MKDLYLPRFEHDACGVGLLCDIAGKKSHAIVRDALQVLQNLEHRGAEGADVGTGDGSGILTAIPRELFLQRTAALALDLGARFGVAMVFLPQAPFAREGAKELLEECARDEGARVLGWREVPTLPSALGRVAAATLPEIWQLFVAPLETTSDELFERQLFVARKQFERRVQVAIPEHAEQVYVASFSSRTIVYKGLLTPKQLPSFYVDLREPMYESAFALVHQRFSTNTFPSWRRAHPYRMIAHNGEINTVRGNVNWMRAREEVLKGSRFAGEVKKLRPIIDESGSDSSMLDNALEVLVHSGRSLDESLTMLVPEAWENDAQMPAARRDYYGYHACFMEPWDGPAALMFSDGRVAGATLDRNGLRPARYVITKDGRLCVASEVGVLDVAESQIARKNRLRPGQMILCDLVNGRLLEDDEIKDALAKRQPYGRWLEDNVVHLRALPPAKAKAALPHALATLHEAFGYSHEDLRMVLQPMAEHGEEPVGSMGNDAPPALLSTRPQPLFAYFRQLFAQVTNPPIDPLREARVMSLATTLGAEASLFEDTPSHCQKLVLEQPILDADQLERLRAVAAPGLKALTLDATFALGALEKAVERLCDAAVQAVDEGATILILSDRALCADRAPIPSLLATSAVHHHLIREGRRTRAGLVVESGEPREVMHMCLLLGYGAGAIHPYVMLETAAGLHAEGVAHTIKALGKGVLKVLSKMGISTLGSYRGAQIFEALGLEARLIDRYFTWTPTRLEAHGLEQIAAVYTSRHSRAFSRRGSELESGGLYQWRKSGEHHAWGPDAIGLLQHAARSGSYATFKRFSAHVDQDRHTIRGRLQIVPQTPVPLEEVEPVAKIVRRFKTGAMSLGSISREVHETLARAMNRLGGRSNTGEGGEDPARYEDDRRSAIKQVASGRFGVTMHYLSNADELQIKMAQGAKPGEGGQLPGHKVSEYIASLRCSTPGVTLVSPPPHHDIYSIEDLAQLIFDLRAANRAARISVKLVAEAGVGTVAAGVAKAKADVIVISGDSGGTGAAPLSAIKHAGVPWELGLAEAHQVLLKNGLRSRVVLETDGQLKTGRDVAIAAMLGAEEFGFATAALVASGCVMMRVCHLNTCPVGIATQDPELRKRFSGEPEHVIAFMGFVASELREIMASLGVRTVEELVGRADMLRAAPDAGLDLEALLAFDPKPRDARRFVPRMRLADAPSLDDALIARAIDALLHGKPVQIDAQVRNTDRAVGTRLSSELVRARGKDGLEPGTIHVALRGTAGQSFGAFAARGVSLHLEGDANDYVGKGLSGGRLVVSPPKDAAYAAELNTVIGNVALYGATSGEAFIRGMAGERFAVRNSGAFSVVEGVGDHGCEYMTGGRVVVLGGVGRNFAAGMSGGIAYVYDACGALTDSCNLDTVIIDALEDHELSELRGWLRLHYDLTESQVAWRLLADFVTTAKTFVRVVPKEYVDVLAQKKAAVR